MINMTSGFKLSTIGKAILIFTPTDVELARIPLITAEDMGPDDYK
jgi:hypothetical protein